MYVCMFVIIGIGITMYRNYTFFYKVMNYNEVMKKDFHPHEVQQEKCLSGL